MHLKRKILNKMISILVIMNDGNKRYWKFFAASDSFDVFRQPCLLHVDECSVIHSSFYHKNTRTKRNRQKSVVLLILKIFGLSKKWCLLIFT